ncbi:hypothetical protein Tco_0179477 [Tanacetum coccineum]
MNPTHPMVVTMERWCRGDGVDVVVRVAVKMMMTTDSDGGVDGATVVRIAARVVVLCSVVIVMGERWIRWIGDEGSTRINRDLSLRTSGPLQDPTTTTITTIIITNGDGIWRVRTFQENNIPRIKVNNWEELAGELML